MSHETTSNEPVRPPPPSTTALDVGIASDDARTLRDPKTERNSTLIPGQSFGEYELLAEIARGGMGVVYRARQTVLDRVVALKMILAGRLANADDVTRFRTEAAAAGRLRHPNIVAVHDVGEFDGQHYFTMEFIEGISLDQKLAQGPLAARIAARYVRILARAVAYAHKQGILHRDLKPSNILIGSDDEPHITDFGLAKRLGPESSGQTRTGAILGTPSYMSPEQAQGRSQELGPASDVYSLGAILYELVTGRPPFRAETPLDTVMQVIDNQAVPPRLLNPKIDHDVETICMKCLEKKASMRYASAEKLGEDLQRYLDGESIHARSFNVLDRLAHVLERDTHTADFSAWSSMVLAMAGIVAGENIGVFGLIVLDQPRILVMLARPLLFVALGFLFWYNRRSRLLPTNAAERELWTIWLGYFAAHIVIMIIVYLLRHQEIIQPHPEWPGSRYLQDLIPYPFLATVAGVAFFIMGANYWGRCYAIGAVFLVAAPLMVLDLTFAPLIFGVIWGVVLLMFGIHLRRQAITATPTPPAPTATMIPSSQVATVQYKDQP